MGRATTTERHVTVASSGSRKLFRREVLFIIGSAELLGRRVVHFVRIAWVPGLEAWWGSSLTTAVELSIAPRLVPGVFLAAFLVRKWGVIVLFLASATISVAWFGLRSSSVLLLLGVLSPGLLLCLVVSTGISSPSGTGRLLVASSLLSQG